MGFCPCHPFASTIFVPARIITIVNIVSAFCHPGWYRDIYPLGEPSSFIRSHHLSFAWFGSIPRDNTAISSSCRILFVRGQIISTASIWGILIYRVHRMYHSRPKTCLRPKMLMEPVLFARLTIIIHACKSPTTHATFGSWLLKFLLHLTAKAQSLARLLVALLIICRSSLPICSNYRSWLENLNIETWRTGKRLDATSSWSHTILKNTACHTPSTVFIHEDRRRIPGEPYSRCWRYVSRKAPGFDGVWKIKKQCSTYKTHLQNRQRNSCTNIYRTILWTQLYIYTTRTNVDNKRGHGQDAILIRLVSLAHLCSRAVGNIRTGFTTSVMKFLGSFRRDIAARKQMSSSDWCVTTWIQRSCRDIELAGTRPDNGRH